jgi:fucose permease
MVKKHKTKSTQKSYTDRGDSTQTLNLREEDLESINDRYLLAEDPYRFVMLFCVSLLNLASGFEWTNIASVSTLFESNYNLTRTETYLFPNLFFIGYILGAFPSFYLIEKRSLEYSVRKII